MTRKTLSLVETCIQISMEICYDQNEYNFLYHHLKEGQNGVRLQLQLWAEEFEKKHSKTDWDKKDWYYAIDKFLSKKLEKLGYDWTKTYSL